MLHLIKQARFFAFPLLFLLATIGQYSPAWAVTRTTKDGTVSVPSDAEHEVSLDDIGGFFDSLAPNVFLPNAPDPKPKAPEKSEEKKKPSQDDDKKPPVEAKTEPTSPDAPKWQAKRGVMPPDTAQNEAKPAYRVYRAPVLQEDAPMPSSPDYGVFMDTAPRTGQPRSLSDRENVTPQIDLPKDDILERAMRHVDPNPPVPTEKMPPPALPASPSANPIRSSDTAPIVPSAQKVVSMVAGQPAGAIPSQFFPIFPSQALPDTPPMMLPIVSNYPLADDHSGQTHALIYIHDLSRNVSEAFTMLTMLNGSGDEGRTMIVAPQFPLEIDVARFASFLPDNGRTVARWPLGRGADGREEGWQTGGDSIPVLTQKNGISSFTAMDLLFLYFADKKRYPDLHTITLAGYGMGADFSHRYAALGQAPEVLTKQGITVRFLLSHPSSYLYLTASRAVASSVSLVKPNAKECAIYDDYPYGLRNLNTYGRKRGENAIRMEYPQRKVTYLFGDKILSDPYLDQTCAASIQGKDRLSRGQNYQQYLSVSFSETAPQNHRFVGLRNVGADPASLFSTKCGASLLFPTLPDACRVQK